MNVLITGGAGYIGTELNDVLLNDDQVERVVVFDNLSRANYNFFIGRKRQYRDKFQFIQGDILDSRTLRKALDGVDTVYHLAAKVTTPFANVDSHFFEQVNHWGTAEMAYALEGSAVKKVIYTSSLGVYGSGNDITDSTEPNPKTFYGTSKLRGEEHIRRLSEHMDTYVIRCGNVYGYSKSMRFDSVINRFAFESNFSNRVSIHGNGKQSRAFIHIDQVKMALYQLVKKEVPSGTYNLVERNLEVLDIIDTFKEVVPPMEFLFINQHLNLRNIKVNTDLELNKYIQMEESRTFKEEIVYFLEQFAY